LDAITGDEDTRVPVSRTYRFPLPPHPIAAEQARLLAKIA
jgi:hypothetical protein